jgi:hypothetical protein
MDVSKSQPLLPTSAREKNVLTDIREDRANQVFWRNLKTSVLMGFIITVFFVPVCSGTLETMIFNNVTYFDDDRVVNGLDLPARLGSPDLESYWPNVVQFVFFTIYSDFGTTVQYAYQGMAGTMLAEMNIFFLLQLFPHGGRCNHGIVEGHFGLKPSCDEYGYADPHYEHWGWILFVVDNVCVTAAVFVLKIGLPVKKWFLCWNCVFMMQFGSTDGLDRSHSVLFTTILGCLLALVSMLPRLRMTDLVGAKRKIVDGLERTLDEVFTFLKPDGKTHPPQAQQIVYGRIKSSVRDVEKTANCMREDLDVTWWETLGIRSRRERNECKKFANLFSMRVDKRNDDGGVVGGLYTVLHLMLRAAEEKIKAEEKTKSWDEQHAHLDETLWKELRSLKVQTMALVRDLFGLPVKANAGGRPSGSKEEKNCEAVAVIPALVPVQARQGTDLPKYYSFFALALELLAEAVVTCSEHEEKEEKGLRDVTMSTAYFLKDAVVATVDVGKERGLNYWNYAYRNTLVILIAFWSGYWLHGAFFLTPFDSYMSVSLAVMLSEAKPGTSLDMNVKRLLGVSIGKSLTLIIMAFVSFFGDTGPVSVVVHIAMVFFFMTFFSYVYYDDGYWSYVACLIAGFGCYTLAGTSADAAWSKSTLTFRYAEICQLTTAIVVRFIIDALDESFWALGAHSTILRCMERLGWGFHQDGNGEAISTKGITDAAVQKLAGHPRKWHSEGTPGVLIQAMKLLWEGEETYADFRARVDEVKQQIQQVAGITTTLSGAAVLARGRQACLDVDLLTVCLDHMTNILHELRTLQVIHNSMKKHHTPNEGNASRPNSWDELIKDMKDPFCLEIKNSMEVAFQMLQMALKKQGSNPIYCQIDTTRFSSTFQSPNNGTPPEGSQSTCREAVAWAAMHEILKLSYSVQSSVWSSGILLTPAQHDASFDAL